jgi:hypothetical protein
MMEAVRSSETAVLTRATRRNIQKDDILHSHSRETLKSYIALTGWSLYVMSPVKYELGFYIPEDDNLHSHRRETLKSYIALTGWALYVMSPVKYELGFYIPEDDNLHSDRRETLKSYIALTGWTLSLNFTALSVMAKHNAAKASLYFLMPAAGSNMRNTESVGLRTSVIVRNSK